MPPRPPRLPAQNAAAGCRRGQRRQGRRGRGPRSGDESGIEVRVLQVLELCQSVLDAGAAVALALPAAGAGVAWVDHLHRVVEHKVVEPALQHVGTALVLARVVPSEMITLVSQMVFQ